MDDGLPVAVEVRHEIFQAFGAVEGLVEGVSFLVCVTFVRQRNGDALIQVRQLTHAVGEGVAVVHECFKNLVVGLEFDGGAPLVGGADFPHGVLLLASGVFLFVYFSVAVHLGPQQGGKGIHTGNPDAVQTAGNLVRVLVKLAPGTNLGHDDLKGADALLFVHVDGDATSVVRDANSVVFRDGHCDRVAVAGKRFVNGVVDDFVHQMVQASDSHVSDVHRRTHAHVLHALEGLNLTGVVPRLPSFLFLF